MVTSYLPALLAVAELAGAICYRACQNESKEILSMLPLSIVTFTLTITESQDG